jgi:hypothetical protein
MQHSSQWGCAHLICCKYAQALVHAAVTMKPSRTELTCVGSDCSLVAAETTTASPARRVLQTFKDPSQPTHRQLCHRASAGKHSKCSTTLLATSQNPLAQNSLRPMYSTHQTSMTLMPCWCTMHNKRCVCLAPADTTCYLFMLCTSLLLHALTQCMPSHSAPNQVVTALCQSQVLCCTIRES